MRTTKTRQVLLLWNKKTTSLRSIYYCNNTRTITSTPTIKMNKYSSSSNDKDDDDFLKNKITDYSKYITRTSARRQPSPIRSLQPLLNIPGMISLGAGNPNPIYFPIQSLQFSLKDGTQLELTESELNTSLQYSNSYGIPEFVDWIKNYQIKEHDLNSKASDSWSVMITSGSTEGIDRALNMLVSESDTIFVESPSYSGTLTSMKAIGCRIIPVPVDSDGIIPDQFESILKSQIEFTMSHNLPRPKLLYTIPTGQNPSGCTTSLSRRRELLSFAYKYDFIILEDDPYRHLTFSDTPIPSYLSLESSPSRVIRFDSFSKILSAGLRVGWATGPSFFIDKMQLHQQVSCLHTSGLSQMVLLKTLKSMQVEGLEQHITKVKAGYKERRDRFCELVKTVLKDRVEWFVPQAGMFVWMKLNGIHDTKYLIEKQAVKEKVLLVPGAVFMVDSESKCSYVRASFSVASFEQMEEALKRLARLLDTVITDTVATVQENK